MPALVVPVLHLAALVALGALSRSRLAVLLAAALAGLSVLLLAPAGDLAAKALPALAADFAGVVLGTLLGLRAASARDRRLERELGPRGAARARARRHGRRGAWVLAALLAVCATAVGLYLEPRLLPAWRTTVDGWLDSPAARAVGLAPPSTQGAAGASRAGATAPSAGASKGGTPGSDASRGRASPAPARPQGDLRHCLDRTDGGEVLRCAEQGR